MSYRYSTIEQICEVLSQWEENRLTPLRFAEDHIQPSGQKARRVECRCSCGAIKVINLYHLINGNTFSCGCLRDDIITNMATKYHTKHKKLYSSYRCMITRCTKPTSASYKWYGGRGVRVCDEWLNSFDSFADWALSNGWGRGLVLDKDILGDGLLYSPQTCKWVTQKVNAKYTRRTTKYYYNGDVRTFEEVCGLAGVSTDTIKRRMELNKIGILEAITDFYFDTLNLTKNNGTTSNSRTNSN